jgi:hypothetical protein
VVVMGFSPGKLSDNLDYIAKNERRTLKQHRSFRLAIFSKDKNFKMPISGFSAKKS